MNTPHIEGHQVTFRWQTTQADETPPLLIGDFNDWGARGTGDAIALTQTAPNEWTHTRSFPSDAYIEYKFTHDPTDPKAAVLDPNNPRKVSNGMGKQNNYLRMPDSRPIVIPRGIKHGKITEHTIRSFALPDAERHVWLYQPPVETPAPLMIVYDGRDYLRRAKLPEVIDHLIAQHQIPPVALAMIDNGKKSRYFEYNNSEMTLSILLEAVLPLAQRNLQLTSPGAYGVIGASMGGLMALYTALRLPGIFTRVISQSGAFLLKPRGEGLIDYLLKTQPTLPLKIWQDVGVYEWLLASNRELHTTLQARGYEVTYREFNAGHNYTAWRDQLPEALRTTFA
ncbi:MAG: alpha/beta hydrolase-fold protein [Anaerolineae bacterium]|jgi:enterochelin esterase family protein|nr:alpha/beta hydrolase-fold protein [Anaerolineae bacterium]